MPNPFDYPGVKDVGIATLKRSHFRKVCNRMGGGVSIRGGTRHRSLGVPADDVTS